MADGGRGAAARPLVLVVDDDRTCRAAVRRALGEGLEVVGAMDAPAADRILALRTPDLVLLDLELPGVRGDVVLQELRAAPATCRIPVLMLTSHHGAHHAARAFADGANGFVHKPFVPAELRAHVDRVLAFGVL